MSAKRELYQFFNDIIDICNQNGISAYFVGGCVRDALIGNESKDYDLAISPEGFEILCNNLKKQYALKKSLFSTFSLTIGDFNIDVAAFRAESYDMDNGLPNITYSDIHQDIYRRDFTINTGYVLISNLSVRIMLSNQEKNHLKVEYCHSDFWHDIENRQIRILHPNSFVQDASRLLRAVKYQVTLNMSLESETKKLFDSGEARTALYHYSQDRYKQIILDYVSNNAGKRILEVLYTEKLLIHTGNDAYEDDLSMYDQVILFLLFIYRANLNFWKNQNRGLNVLIGEIEDLKASFKVNELQNSWASYQCLKGKSLSSILLSKRIIENEITRREIEYYLEETRHIKLNISGSDLKSLGITEGKEIGQLLEALLKYKVNNHKVMTSEEEIKWIVSKINEY